MAVAETTALLEQRFDHILFTGSTNVGRIVMTAAAQHLTPVTLELGGKSPTIVAADADLEVAARRIMWGKFLNAGQTCIAPDYVLVEASVRDELVAKMASTLGEFYGTIPGAPTTSAGSSTDRTGVGSRACSTRAKAWSSRAARSTRTIATSPRPSIVDPDPDGADHAGGDLRAAAPRAARSTTIDDAVRFVNERPKPLALYVFSGSSDTADDVIERTSSGGACVNHCVLHILPSELPFGGVGPSGMGAYHGKLGFDTFSHLKSVLYKPQKPDLKLLYPPYTAWKDKLAHKAM